MADGLPSPEDVSHGALVHLPSLPLTCTLLACRLGKCWEPRRLKMKTSRLQSCPSRGKSVRPRPESHLKLKIALGLDSTGGCSGWTAPYVSKRTDAETGSWAGNKKRLEAAVKQIRRPPLWRLQDRAGLAFILPAALKC